MEEKPARGPLQERRLWWSDSSGHSRLAREVGPHSSPCFPNLSLSAGSISILAASTLEHTAGRLAAAFTISPVPTSS
jgi:hypothetical protein